jgi:hypothetical protein
MTVNAAILAGIVKTSQSSSIYSGGAHNLMRFLEDRTNKTLTYNGSMVVLYNSIRAIRPFQQPGSYYEPPERNLAFDLISWIWASCRQERRSCEASFATNGSQIALKKVAL